MENSTRKTKYIFVTGGVVSGLGKGITAASLGRLLKARGLKVAAQKLDPYEHKLLGITAMTKLLGRTRFDELLGQFIEKPQGKPALVPVSDKRPPMNSAAEDFDIPF